MDKNKKPQALDDEALDQVSGGIQFTTLIHKDKKGRNAAPNGLIYHGEQVQTSRLVFHSDLGGLTANNLIGQDAGAEDGDRDLISL